MVSEISPRFVSDISSLYVRPCTYTTPLMDACHNGNLEKVEEILTSADSLEKTINEVYQNNGYSALLFACASNRGQSLQIAKLLIQLGADVYKKDINNNNILMLSTSNSNGFETFKYIMELNCIDIAEKNYRGDSCFMLACKEGKLKICEYFMLHTDCDIFQKSGARHVQQDGFTFAMSFEQYQIVVFLVEHGWNIDENVKFLVKELRGKILVLHSRIQMRMKKIKKLSNVMKKMLRGKVDVNSINVIQSFAFGSKNLKNFAKLL